MKNDIFVLKYLGRSNDGHNNVGNIPMFPTEVSVPMSSPLSEEPIFTLLGNSHNDQFSCGVCLAPWPSLPSELTSDWWLGILGISADSVGKTQLGP